ncbi:MAG: hypothetical protein ACYTF1_22010 [Planctomycetota bacterium]|jgi:hypothetical protein
MKTLTLWLHYPSEMAELREGKSETLFIGNFWDFHPGCHGTEITFANGDTIDFIDEWDFVGPKPTARMIANKINAKLVIKERKTPFPY